MSTCATCGDAGWIPDVPDGTDVPCTTCNAGSPPRPPADFVSFVRDEEPFYKPGLTPPARLSVGQPGELLFEFLRAPDRSPITCELRFNGESYGWEAQFFERGELWYARGAFVTRALAVQWAEEERKTIKR